ncbi:hypothetical protein SXCC_01545 [Gluconacetobacter sp. SXCC-1]|nr:hypothetical protein SXCC_01545 [Gluconacetobacter sp. SXCC-1]
MKGIIYYQESFSSNTHGLDISFLHPSPDGSFVVIYILDRSNSRPGNHDAVFYSVVHHLLSV